LTWHPVYSSIYGILEKINILILMLLNSVTLKNQKESFNKYQPKSFKELIAGFREYKEQGETEKRKI